MPKERLRMTKATVTDSEQISEEVRKEEIEAEGTDLESEPGPGERG